MNIKTTETQQNLTYIVNNTIMTFNTTLFYGNKWSVVVPWAMFSRFALLLDLLADKQSLKAPKYLQGGTDNLVIYVEQQLGLTEFIFIKYVQQ